MSQVCEAILQEISQIVSPLFSEEEKTDYLNACRSALSRIGNPIVCQSRMDTFRKMMRRCPVGVNSRSWAHQCREKIYGQ